MGFPAARIGDMHVCPMVTPAVVPVPHVGGPILGPGCPTVLIGGMPAAAGGRHVYMHWSSILHCIRLYMCINWRQTGGGLTDMTAHGQYRYWLSDRINWGCWWKRWQWRCRSGFNQQNEEYSSTWCPQKNKEALLKAEKIVMGLRLNLHRPI